MFNEKENKLDNTQHRLVRLCLLAKRVPSLLEYVPVIINDDTKSASTPLPSAYTISITWTIVVIFCQQKTLPT